jgi:hypothetical protein
MLLHINARWKTSERRRPRGGQGSKQKEETDDVASDETAHPIRILLQHVRMIAIMDSEAGRIGSRGV